ncbi:glycosyltransferase [Lachnospiraceae bacterium 66-29]
MRILYYTWFENSQEDMEETLIFLGNGVVKCNIPFEDYEQDQAFTEQLSKIIEEYACDTIFSFNFFPLIAKTAKSFQIKYISWIYDCPHWTLYSPTAKYACNYIFVFDQVQFLSLKQLEIPHLYHFPLAVNTRRLGGLLKSSRANVSTDSDDNQSTGIGNGKTLLQGNVEDSPIVSFVGSLYENNRYDQIQYLPEYLRGYLEGIIKAQEQIYGYNFISELLTEDIQKQMNQCIVMELPKSYPVSKQQLYAAMLNEKVTSQERIFLLNSISHHYPLTLYTASNMAIVPRAKNGGTVSYRAQMPQVFCRSKINLNMTLRSIQSGIPLRALDIMGAGGFLLSNYQTELAEQFEDGKELVLYGSAEELLDKISYYLSHEEERQEIAHCGFLKVQKLFSYETRVRQMFQLVQEHSF